MLGERNPADTLTKPLPGRKILEWSEHVGKDGCSNHDDSNSKLEKYCVVENERTMRTESENAERQRSRVRSKKSNAQMAWSHATNLETSLNVAT